MLPQRIYTSNRATIKYFLAQRKFNLIIERISKCQDEFLYDKQISNSVSSFALKYMLDYHYIFKSSGGYSTGYIDQHEALHLLRKDFSNEIEIEDYHLFQLPSVIAILSEGHLHVEYNINPNFLPHSLKEYSTQKSSFSGEQLKE